jgi:cation diffusion facilitator family transporter
MSEKKTVALTSVIAAVLLTCFKLIVGFWTNSLGILSEAAHSGFDLIAALITLFAVNYSELPADNEHHYGHGKIENISAFVETLILAFTCGWVIWEAVDRLVKYEHHAEANLWSFVVMGVSIIVDVSRSRALYRVAKKQNSQALEADALHFSSDIWSSATVIGGLVFVKLGYPVFDSVAAITVAILVLIVSYRLGRRTVDALMDCAPLDKRQKVEEAIQAIEGVEQLKSLRIRMSGSRMFVDTTILLCRTLPFQRAHSIMDSVEDAVRRVEPRADVVVHAEPFECLDETMVDKIRMIVVNEGLSAPHNLEIHIVDGKYHINFDMEYKQGHTFTEAHAIASKVEQKIYDKLPSVSVVTIHIEEYIPSEKPLTNVTSTEHSLTREILSAVQAHEDVFSCKDLTLLQEDSQYNASFTCVIDQSRTIEQVHQSISEIKAELFSRFKQLRRVTIHAEPK